MSRRPARVGVGAAVVAAAVFVGPSAWAGAAECKITGTATGDGRLIVVVTGEATYADHPDVVAVELVCTLRQGNTTVMQVRSVPGPATLTAGAGTIPEAPTRVCTSGTVYYSDDRVVHFGNENC